MGKLHMYCHCVGKDTAWLHVVVKDKEKNQYEAYRCMRCGMMEDKQLTYILLKK